jgi:hypothetical protein
LTTFGCAQGILTGLRQPEGVPSLCCLAETQQLVHLFQVAEGSGAVATLLDRSTAGGSDGLFVLARVKQTDA